MAADLKIIVNGTPTPVFMGENTTIAALKASQAGVSEANASESAAFAEEFSGPAYATVEAGELATTPGQFFRVPIPDTDPVEYSRYQRTADGSVEAAPLATTAALASPTGASLVSSGTASVGDLLDLHDIQFGISGAADETAQLKNALAAMSALRRKLVITRDVHWSGDDNILIEGFCDIEIRPGGRIFNAGGTGSLRIVNNYRQVTTFESGAIGEARYPGPTTSVLVDYIDVADASELAVDDVIYIKDDKTDTYSWAGSNEVGIAEIFRIIGIDGERLYLSGKFLETPVESGTIWLLPDERCRLRGELSGELTTPHHGVFVKGYVDADIDVDAFGNSGPGVTAVSCYGGTIRCRARNLLNDPGANFYGYGVITYAACKDIQIEVHAENVRHAFTDGIIGNNNIEAGVCRNLTVTGVARGCSSAAFDTHPSSDGVRFENIKVWQGHNTAEQPDSGQVYALQLRGTNSTVDGFETDMLYGVMLAVVPIRPTITRLLNFVQRAKDITPYSETWRRMVGVALYKLAGPGAQRVIARNCDLGYLLYQGIIDFDEWHGCRFDWSRTTAGWPAQTVGAGGRHRLIDCIVERPVNLVIGANDEWILEGGSVRPASAHAFALAAAAKLTAINHMIEIASGNIANAAYAYSNGAGCTFVYANVSVRDGRAQGSVLPWRDIAATGDHSVKNIALAAPLFAVQNVDIPSVAAGGSETVNVTVAGVFAAGRWDVAVTPSADLGGLLPVARVSGTDTVQIRFSNPTAAPIDPASMDLTVKARLARI